MKVAIFVVLLFSVASYVSGLKVLGILPLGSKSHFAIGSSIVNSLHGVGHKITVISPFPLSKPKERYRDIDISDMLIESTKEENNLNPFEFGKAPVMIMVFILSQFGSKAAEFCLSHENVKKLMNSGEKFDLCVLEIFNNEALLGLADHFGCVLVTYTTFGAVKWVDELTGNRSPPSYSPNPFLHFTDKMTFTQRLWNGFVATYENLVFEFYHLSKQRSLYEKYFPNSKRSFDEMLKNTSIIFVNSHVTSSFPRPSMPNVVDILGVHVKPPKPLSVELQEFADSAKDGLIVFTMGSYINCTSMDTEKRDAIVRSFSKLKQKVIWKYENETLPGNAGNIKISSWLPQRDLLAHRNVKVFITHGGLLGTTEALVEGVPLLGIPIFGDQKMNMAKAELREYGLQVPYDDLNEETFSKALNEILSNPKFRENAKVISKRFNDRPLTPQQEVVYWTEYAMRHDGAAHLKAAALDLSYIQLNSIDVYVTLLVILIVVLYIEFLILRLVFRKLFCKKQEKVVKQKKN